MIHISDITWSTKYSKVRNIRLFTSDKFMRCFLRELVQINLVDDMTCSIDSFSPEPDRCLVFSKHCSGHLNKSSILPFNNTILLRCISSREFMSETIGIKKFFDMCILEFCTIITSDMFQRYFIFSLSSLSESFEDIDHFAVTIEKEYPSIPREIIDNNETILVASQASII